MPDPQDAQAITVRVFHNVARDENGRMVNFVGWRPHHEMVLVFAYELPAAAKVTPQQIADEAFAMFNGFPESDAGRELTERYYQRRLRSLSVGDIIMVGEAALACCNAGWSPVTGWINDVTATHTDLGGNTPLLDRRAT